MILTLSLPDNSHFEQNTENAYVVIFFAIMIFLQGLMAVHYYKHRFCCHYKYFWPVFRDGFFVMLALYLLLIFLLYFI